MANGPNGPITFNYGDGLSQDYAYDSMGRRQGGWLCPSAPSFGCSGPQRYGFYNIYTGSQISTSSDNITGQNTAYTYDEFNRLKTANYSGMTFNYTYDRYGNRWSQGAPQGGPAPSFLYNLSKNQIANMLYDAAGNLSNDGSHTYQYDAEGNQTGVDNNQTAQYSYDATNHRVLMYTPGLAAHDQPTFQEINYDQNGRRLSIWDGGNGSLVQAQVYWGSTPLAYYKEGALHFQHQDWLGSERVTTSATGATEWALGNYPFGETRAEYGKNIDADRFSQLDHNEAANTEHAQFREYSNAQGRWMSPDPYDGSMDLGNPQSLNRYNYVGNNPLKFTDPSGLFGQESGAAYTIYVLAPWCASCAATGLIDLLSGPVGWVIGGLDAAYELSRLLGAWNHPQMKESIRQRPKDLVKQGQRMLSNNCNSKLANTIPHYTNSSFFNQLANAPFEEYPAGTSNIPDHIYGADADTALGQKGRPIRLFPNFYGNDSAYQAFTLIHEGIHRFTGWSDSQVFMKFGPAGLQPPGSGYGTGNITSWLQEGCQP